MDRKNNRQENSSLQDVLRSRPKILISSNDLLSQFKTTDDPNVAENTLDCCLSHLKSTSGETLLNAIIVINACVCGSQVFRKFVQGSYIQQKLCRIATNKKKTENSQMDPDAYQNMQFLLIHYLIQWHEKFGDDPYFESSYLSLEEQGKIEECKDHIQSSSLGELIKNDNSGKISSNENKADDNDNSGGIFLNNNMSKINNMNINNRNNNIILNKTSTMNNLNNNNLNNNLRTASQNQRPTQTTQQPRPSSGSLNKENPPSTFNSSTAIKKPQIDVKTNSNININNKNINTINNNNLNNNIKKNEETKIDFKQNNLNLGKTDSSLLELIDPSGKMKPAFTKKCCKDLKTLIDEYLLPTRFLLAKKRTFACRSSISRTHENIRRSSTSINGSGSRMY